MSRESSIIQGIMITEKGTALSEKHNQYFFRVDPSATKSEIRAAVEKGFKVSVKCVNTMKCRGKMKRERTQHYGRRPDWKRAIVTLREGSKIELT